MSRSRWPLVALFVGIALLCARLGLWQVDRLQQRRSANAAVAAARDLPPVDLNTAGRVTGLAAGRAVVARGTARRGCTSSRRCGSRGATAPSS